MKLQSVESREFRKYGRIIEEIDVAFALKILDGIAVPGAIEYVASYQPLEEPSFRDRIQDHYMGGLSTEIGYCCGHNRILNALEYHRSSEINIAGTDVILLLGSREDIEPDNTYDTQKLEAFFVPAGTTVELYNSTLHFAPCGTEENGYAFKTVCILPYGTNFDNAAGYEPLHGEERLYYAKNKWLIAHEEAKLEGAFVGLKGKNISLEDIEM